MQRFLDGDLASIDLAISNVKESDARITLVITFETAIEDIIFKADDLNLIRAGYVWITTDALGSPQDVVDNSQDPARMAALLSGWMRLSTGAFYGEYGRRFDSVWTQEPVAHKLHPLLADDASTNYTDTCSEFCGYTYDAVWTVAIAAANTTVGADGSMDADELLANIRRCDFEGATGRVRFDALTGDRDPALLGVNVGNFQAKWDVNGSYAGISEAHVLEWNTSGLYRVGVVPPEWPGGNRTWTPPSDGSSCPIGHQFSSSLLSCVPCQAGHALINGTCTECPVGQVAPFEAMTSCIPCSEGFANAPGMTACIPCPDKTSRKLGTPGLSQLECGCLVGYYPKDGPGEACEICVSGGVCEGGDMQPYPMEGFWGDRDCKEFNNGTGKECWDYTKFLPCNPGWNCLGGQDFACEQGRRGRLCQEAIQGFFIVGGSFWNPCGKNDKLVTVGLISLVVAAWFVINHFASQKYFALNIALLFVQINALIGMYNLKWTRELDYLNIALSVANFDVDFVTPHCIGPWGLVASFYLQLALPWVFGISRSLLVAVRRAAEDLWSGTYRGRYWHTSRKQILSFVSTMYATLCIKCFQTFRCERYPDGHLYLSFAPEVECWTTSHIAMFATSILYTVGVLVGMPMLILWNIKSHQRDGTLHHPKVVEKWGWVHDAYESEYKYWEVVLIVRKIVIAGIAIVVTEPMLQGAFTIVVLAVLLSAHVYTAPYIRRTIDVMDFTSLVASILYALAGMLVYPAVTEKAQGRMCADDLFLVDDDKYCSQERAFKHLVTVSAIVVTCVNLVLAFGIFARRAQHDRYSELASKLAMERCKTLGEDRAGLDTRSRNESIPTESLNQLELDEVLQGPWLHAWAKRLGTAATYDALSSDPRRTATATQSMIHTLAGSPEAFYSVNDAIRELDEDVTDYSRTPLAESLRNLCKIRGLIEYLSWSKSEHRADFCRFFKTLSEFRAQNELEKNPFPLSSLFTEEYRSLVVYFLIAHCDDADLMRDFANLTDAIVEANGKSTAEVCERRRKHASLLPPSHSPRSNSNRSPESPLAGASSPLATTDTFISRSSGLAIASVESSNRDSNRTLILPTDVDLGPVVGWLPTELGNASASVRDGNLTLTHLISSLHRRIQPKLIRRAKVPGQPVTVSSGPKLDGALGRSRKQLNPPALLRRLSDSLLSVGSEAGREPMLNAGPQEEEGEKREVRKADSVGERASRNDERVGVEVDLVHSTLAVEQSNRGPRAFVQRHASQSQEVERVVQSSTPSARDDEVQGLQSPDQPWQLWPHAL